MGKPTAKRGKCACGANGKRLCLGWCPGEVSPTKRGKKIGDKKLLDWMEQKLQLQVRDPEGIGITPGGMTYISGMAWPNRSIRKAITDAIHDEDAFIRAKLHQRGK